MVFVNYDEDPHLFAKMYSNLNISGTAFVEFRDVPKLIEKHVSGRTTLDFGCGAGRSLSLLKSLGYNVDGADINTDMLQLCKQNHPDTVYIKIDQCTLPVDSKKYDFVFVSHVFGEISKKEDVLSSLKEIARVLKSDGTLIFMTDNYQFFTKDWLSYDTTCFPENEHPKSGKQVRVRFKDINLEIVNYFWTEKDYEEMLHQAGFGIIEIHQPIGTDNDGFDWINEGKVSPIDIYVVKKRSD